MVIIAIVTGAAVLTLGQNQTKNMQRLAESFAEAFQLAEEKAMLDPRVIGVAVNQRQLAFLQYRETETRHWRDLNDHALPVQFIPSDLEVRVQVLNQSKDREASSPQIVISENGDVTPFIMTIGKRGKKPLFQVLAKPDGSLTTERLSS